MYLGHITRIPSTLAALGWHLYLLMFGKKLSIGGAHGVGAIAFISIPSLRNAFICSVMKTLCVLTSGIGNMWDSVSTLKAITSLPSRTMTYQARTLQWCIPDRGTGCSVRWKQLMSSLLDPAKWSREFRDRYVIVFWIHVPSCTLAEPPSCRSLQDCEAVSGYLATPK